MIREFLVVEERMRERIFQYINGPGVVSKLMEKIMPEVDTISLTCENKKCQDTVPDMVKSYLRLRLYYHLREEDRRIRQPKQKKNKKILKLSHL